jgi:hypothetical protein
VNVASGEWAATFRVYRLRYRLVLEMEMNAIIAQFRFSVLSLRY